MPLDDRYPGIDMPNPGTVYLIHFETPLSGHASHYIGWAKQLDLRLAHHRKGTGARLMAEVGRAGIDWFVAKTWPGDKRFERALKNKKHASRFCPACGGTGRVPA